MADELEDWADEVAGRSAVSEIIKLGGPAPTPKVARAQQLSFWDRGGDGSSPCLGLMRSTLTGTSRPADLSAASP